MKYLRSVGLMSSLLIAGVLGGLMAPLPSEALTVTMNGSTVSTTSRSCDAGYTLCLSIVNGPVAGGTWKVGNASGTNTARVMIADNSAANSLDLLKMTGITFEPVGPTPGVARTLTVVVTHTYNAGGGNPAGNYSWGYGMSGYFDPPGPSPTENIVGNRLRQTGNGNFAGTNVTLGSGLDTGVLATPSTNNLNGSISRTSPATVVRPNCNTGSNRCAPTITQTYTITVVGADKLVMTDSFVAGGGTCRDDGPVPIAPHLYALMLKLDPQAPNDINELSAWLKRMGEKYLNKPTQKKLLAYLIHELDKWLAKTVPGTCPEVEGEVDEVLLIDVEDLEREIVRLTALGEVFETAQPGGTIMITKNTNQATNETFTFNISDGESSTTETIAMDGQTSQSIVVTVEPGTYSVNEINNPANWRFKNANCGDIGDPTASGVVGVGVEVDGNVNCTFNNKTFISDDYRVIDLPGLTWNKARAAAQALSPGTWDLVDIRSQEEQDFIQTLLPLNPTQIPGTHDYWTAGEQPVCTVEPGCTWRWATDSFVFYNTVVTPGGMRTGELPPRVRSMSRTTRVTRTT